LGKLRSSKKLTTLSVFEKPKTWEGKKIMNIKDRFLPYIKGFFLGIIISLCFMGVSVLLAWTSPTSDPPGGNVSGPINISTEGQTKEGGLMLNTEGADVGLIVLKGKVGIGTENPSVKLDVKGKIFSTDNISTEGQIYATDDICIGSGACLSDMNNFLGSQSLVNSVHTYKNCTDAGGEVVDSDTGLPQCRFSNGVESFCEVYFSSYFYSDKNIACPSGWTQYKNYSTTIKSIYCYYTYHSYGTCENPSTTCTCCTDQGMTYGYYSPAGHSWRDRAQEFCRHGETSNQRWWSTAFAIRTQIGCY